MPPDPIKAALVAAGEAARKAFIVPGCCMEGTGCEMPPCHCSQVAAAAAVAAFLRALPPYQIRATGLVMIGEDLREFAAAVERAAQEARDD